MKMNPRLKIPRHAVAPLAFVLVGLTLGCDQGSGSGHAPGRDSAGDLVPNGLDGATIPDASAQDTSRAAADGGCPQLDDIAIDKLILGFGTYHSQQEIGTYLRSVATAVPEIAQYKVLGQSPQGREVAYLVINATCREDPPAILANGTHHGDEASSTEAALAIPTCLFRDAVTDPAVRNLLTTFAFYVLPLVNPDGQAAGNRNNANDLDINRDYSYPGRSDANSFKTVEAQLIRSLHESVGFRAAIAYHSGIEEVLWPWCHTGAAAADDAWFRSAGQKAASAMGFAIYQQSYDDYPTTGEYIDYAYWKDRTLAATFEVSTARAPAAPQLAAVVERACKGTFAWIQAAAELPDPLLNVLSSAGRRTFPRTAPFNGVDRLE